MYANFYKSQVEKAVESGNLVTGLCPFHEDSTPSFSAFADSGLWACFGACNLKGKSPEEFVSRKMKVSLTDAASLLTAMMGAKSSGRPKAAEKPDLVVPEEAVREKHEALIGNTAVMTELTNLRLWSLEAIKEFSIGWDERDDRIWIPVKGPDGWVDVRRYDWKHKHPTKFLPYDKGYGKPRVWPHPPVPTEEVFLLEGEPDCMLARSLGFNAYTNTGGAGSAFKLSAKKLVILYDSDEAGQRGAEKTSALLRKSCGEIKVIELPKWEGMPHNADFTDYIKAHGQAGVDVFRQLLTEGTAELDQSRLTLAQAIADRNFGRTMRVGAVASGKNLTPFQVPKTGAVACPQGQSICKKCGIEASGGQHEFEIRDDSPKLIECADEETKKVRGTLREHLGIPTACTAAEVEVRTVQNLYSLRLTSLVDLRIGNERSPYVAIQAWSTRDLELNTPFILTSKAMPDPKNQAGTLLITKVESDLTSIDDFKLTAEEQAALKVFQPGV